MVVYNRFFDKKLLSVHCLTFISIRSRLGQLVGRLPIIKDLKAKESEILSSVYTSSETTAFCPLYIRNVVVRVGHPEFETLISRFLVNEQSDAQILFYMFISIYNSLHVSSTLCSSSGETNCINTASGNSHSMLVAEMCAIFFQHNSATNIE